MLAARLLDQVFEEGSLTVIDASGHKHRFGSGGAPDVAIRLHDKSLHTKIFLRPEISVGEAYTDGTLTVENGDLYDFLDLCGRNYNRLASHPVSRWSEHFGRLLRGLHQYNPVSRAQRNVAHHYDLSSALYDLFLDRDRQYSCAYFATDNDTLESAQANKKRHIAAKLLLQPGQKILDIGSGWGGTALFLAKISPDSEVTGITLSKEQQAAARRRAEEAGLDGRVAFELRDYRQEQGRYDRVVSVGMFEHVGVRHYREFFSKIKELLNEDGVALIHSIGRMEPPGSCNAWLRKYIFPGGYTPALSEVLSAVEDSGLWVTDIEILRLHYAKTLSEWRRRFADNREKVVELYDERFFRMWEFYLAGCETSFRYMRQMVFQLQLAKQQDKVPLTRDYITHWERDHGDSESAST